MSLLSRFLAICWLTALCLPTIANGQQKESESASSIAQKESLRYGSLRAQSLELGLLDPLGYPLGLQYSLMFTKQSSVVLGVGLLSFGSGFRYYFRNPGSNNLRISAGIQGSWLWESSGLSIDEQSESLGYAVYFPISMHFWTKRNVSTSLAVGPLWLDNPSYLGYQVGSVPLYVTATVGYRPGYDYSEAKRTAPTSSRHLLSGRLGLINPFASLVYEFLFKPWLSAETSIGLLGFTGGINAYYPALRKGRFSMKAGLQAGVFTGILYTEPTFHLPIGITYLSKNRWLVGLDIGPQQFSEFDLHYGISGRLGISL